MLIILIMLNVKCKYCWCDSISESLATLNREKSSVISHHSVVSTDSPVTNGHAASTSSPHVYHTDPGRLVAKQSTLKPLNTASSLSSTLDSSVQTVIEKMNSGLEVLVLSNFVLFLLLCSNYLITFSSPLAHFWVCSTRIYQFLFFYCVCFWNFSVFIFRFFPVLNFITVIFIFSLFVCTNCWFIIRY